MDNHTIRLNNLRNLEKQELEAMGHGNDYAAKSIAYQLEQSEKLRCRIRDEINTRPEAQECITATKEEP